MKGYKVFNSDWTCRGFQYEAGKTYEMNKMPVICECGFHFCTDPKNCFRYYDFWGDIIIAEIEALGDIDMEYTGGKYCTNKIKIIRELSLKDAKIEIETIKENATLFFLFINNNSCLYPPLACPVKLEKDTFVSPRGVSYVKLEVIKSITFSEEE